MPQVLRRNFSSLRRERKTVRVSSAIIMQLPIIGPYGLLTPVIESQVINNLLKHINVLIIYHNILRDLITRNRNQSDEEN